jgi:TolB-like protein
MREFAAYYIAWRLLSSISIYPSAPDLRRRSECAKNEVSLPGLFLQAFGGKEMPRKNLKVSPKCPSALRTIALVLIILVAALAVWQPLFAAPAATYDDAIKQISAQLADSIAASGKKSVAVTDFADLDGNVTELGRFVAGEIADSLAAQAKGFIVIDRTHSQGTPQAASASAVDTLVIGSVTTFSDHVRLTAKVLDAANSAILATASVDIPRTKDVDELLGRSPSARSSASSASAASGSPAAAQTAPGPIPAASGSAPPAKQPRGSGKPSQKPSAPAIPTDSGTGSVATDAYRIVATSLTRSAGNVTVNLEFDSVSDSTVQLAMVRAETYLTDETGVRWTLNQIDTAGIFNVRAMAGGGFWRGVPLAKGGKIQTVLTFTPQGPAAGSRFTLTISEFRPKWNRTVAIEGLK